MDKRILKKYAKLIASKGLNIQKGQDCVVECEVDCPEFIEMLVEEIYKCGARRVIVDIINQKISKLNYKYCSLETLSTLEKWETEKWSWKAETLPALCYIISEDPDGLNGIDREKMSDSKVARYKFIKPFRDKMEAKYQWCIAAAAGKDWAKKVFPDDKSSVAVEKLWKAILTSSRAIGDPNKNWDEHNSTLKAKYDYLNSQGFVKLHYSASNGTNFTVGLIENSHFIGGSEKTLSGIEFNPNIPSEEIYISPKAGDCEGILFSSKPLSFDGQLIENFSIRFAGGRVVEVKAEKNQQLLEKIVKMDDGASKLGECALVPFESPINQSGVTFFETLFDENACCHFALGKGFVESIVDFEKYSLDECRKFGINESMIHVDFMIGTSDLKIEGIKKDGSIVAIFENGNWAK